MKIPKWSNFVDKFHFFSKSRDCPHCGRKMCLITSIIDTYVSNGKEFVRWQQFECDVCGSWDFDLDKQKWDKCKHKFRGYKKIEHKKKNGKKK